MCLLCLVSVVTQTIGVTTDRMRMKKVAVKSKPQIRSLNCTKTVHGKPSTTFVYLEESMDVDKQSEEQTIQTSSMPPSTEPTPAASRPKERNQ